MDRAHEQQLVEQAQQGDQAAFAELIMDSKRRMWSVALSVTGNKHDAEDAIQNAMVSAWKNIDRFRPEARFSTWIYRITSNAALELLRKRRDIPDDEAGYDEPDDAAPIQQRVTTAIVVRQALNDLEPEFKEALVLREYGGLSYDEIAQHQKVPTATVKRRLNRARTKLKAALEERGLP